MKTFGVFQNCPSFRPKRSPNGLNWTNSDHGRVSFASVALGYRYPLAIENDNARTDKSSVADDINSTVTGDEAKTDARLAADLAHQAGVRLQALKSSQETVRNPWHLGHQGDRLSNTYILGELQDHRPADAIMSEESPDDRHRLTADRCWIVDPLDGSSDYPYADSAEWAVHVALVEDDRAVAGAVAIPGLDQVFATDVVEAADRPDRDRPLVVSNRSNPGLAAAVAAEINADVVACGSAGVKAMLVVNGTVDVYIHASGLWEWDVCAPAAVAAAAGMVVSDLDGNNLVYNKPHPIVRGFVVSRPEWAEQTRQTLNRLL